MKGKAGIGILVMLGLTINFGVYLKGQRARSAYKVIKVEGKTITINAGRRDGVRVGYEGKAYKEAQFQGRSIQITTCEFRVVWVGANSSRAEVSSVSPSDPPAPGQKVAFRRELVPQGQIYITSVPVGAEVFMGRQRLGVTPFRVWLEPGAYTLRLAKANYKEAEISVVVESGQVVRRNVNLTPSITFKLKMDSQPSGADVYLDGQRKGVTPLIIEVDPGKYIVKIEKEGYKPIEEEINLSLFIEKKYELISQEAKLLTKWGSEGEGNYEFNYPRDIAVDFAGNVYVVDTDNHRIMKFNSEGKFITKWGGQR